MTALVAVSPNETQTRESSPSRVRRNSSVSRLDFRQDHWVIGTSIRMVYRHVVGDENYPGSATVPPDPSTAATAEPQSKRGQINTVICQLPIRCRCRRHARHRDRR